MRIGKTSMFKNIKRTFHIGPPKIALLRVDTRQKSENRRQITRLSFNYPKKSVLGIFTKLILSRGLWKSYIILFIEQTFQIVNPNIALLGSATQTGSKS